MSISEEKLALIILASFSGFGPATLKKLKKIYSSWQKALNTSSFNLEKIGLKNSVICDFYDFKKEKKYLKILNTIKKENIFIISQDDSDFPGLLKQIPSPPYLLFALGNRKLINNEYLLTVVGSRITNNYNLHATKKLIKELNKKVVIVSGLAKGIDTAAHLSALESKKKTVAILGSGLNKDSIYPKENNILAKQIIQSGGLILSEFPPHTPPIKTNFPQRNRLLAGISSNTLVIGAGEKSGALITANLALDFNRNVLAVPANLFTNYSQGSNYLLKSGASVILESKDIEENLNII